MYQTNLTNITNPLLSQNCYFIATYVFVCPEHYLCNDAAHKVVICLISGQGCKSHLPQEVFLFSIPFSLWMPKLNA